MLEIGLQSAYLDTELSRHFDPKMLQFRRTQNFDTRWWHLHL